MGGKDGVMAIPVGTKSEVSMLLSVGCGADRYYAITVRQLQGDG